MIITTGSVKRMNLKGDAVLPVKRPKCPSRRKLRRSFDLISDALAFRRLCYGEPNAISNAVDYAKFYSRSHPAIIRVFDESGAVIEAHEHTGDFREW